MLSLKASFEMWMRTWTHIKRKRRVEINRVAVRRLNLKSSRDEDDGKTDPEPAVRRKSSATEYIA